MFVSTLKKCTSSNQQEKEKGDAKNTGWKNAACGLSGDYKVLMETLVLNFMIKTSQPQYLLKKQAFKDMAYGLSKGDFEAPSVYRV